MNNWAGFGLIGPTCAPSPGPVAHNTAILIHCGFPGIEIRVAVYPLLIDNWLELRLLARHLPADRVIIWISGGFSPLLFLNFPIWILISNWRCCLLHRGLSASIICWTETSCAALPGVARRCAELLAFRNGLIFQTWCLVWLTFRHLTIPSQETRQQKRNGLNLFENSDYLLGETARPDWDFLIDFIGVGRQLLATNFNSIRDVRLWNTCRELLCFIHFRLVSSCEVNSGSVSTNSAPLLSAPDDGESRRFRFIFGHFEGLSLRT